MGSDIQIACPTCFAIPGELCRTKYLVHGRGRVTPVVCPTHSTRLAVHERALMHQALARQICAMALQCLDRQRGPKRRQES
jgi:hypothetical protein